ncbi:MAG: protein kinase, partial [Clostridia bacterium]|nr:protein kinase [Clostridia bacterium]
MSKTVWPGWKTIGMIGRGGFGEVYEVERDVAGLEKAAVKRISIPQDSGEIEELYASGCDDVSLQKHFNDYLQEFLKEYRLMADLKGNTNIVSCDDVRYEQHDDGIGWDIYIRMELLIPLMKVLDHIDTEEQVIKVGRDICNALVLCRSRNIVHRDIKPQNIFVS